jgi:CelD/BcsL family acetyltransferase involved in cellulose biosynthesis
MSHYAIHHLTSIADLRSSASAWDDLWWRSETTWPTVRAELLAQWLEKFAADEKFHALVVEENGHFVAALPLISGRLAKILSVGSMTTNPWMPCGDLLLDPTADIEQTLSRLLSAAADLPWPLLWLNDAAIDMPRWRAVSDACRHVGISTVKRPRFQVAKIEIADNWETFKKGLSHSHRRAMVKSEKLLNDVGDFRLEMLSQLQPEEVHPWLEKVFAVEDSSWKGESGSSVLRAPGMSDFFLRQARQLAAWGQLEIALLLLDGHPIASLFGFSAKGVYHAHKIGYDPKYRQYGPGQMLFWKILEQLHAQGNWKAIDCIGPLTEATSRWRPKTYRIGRIALAPKKLLGRAALQAYRCLWPKNCGSSLSQKPPSKLECSKETVKKQ